MREIKFRAWDKLNYRFLSMPLVGIDFENDCVNSYEIEQIADTEYKMVQNVCYSYELMQCTGLLDKQGVEIFEGDIVSCQNKVGQVKYEKSMFIVDFIKAKGHLFSISDECIVVGNIYEHKELLNTKGITK
jgi:uncharacterized phage protein (TIGR01671 family)